MSDYIRFPELNKLYSDRKIYWEMFFGKFIARISFTDGNSFPFSDSFELDLKKVYF